MMNSVEPLRSAAWTTSNVHSGCAMTLPVGILLPEGLDLRHGESRVDRAVPLPQDQSRVARLLRREAAVDLVRIPDHHAIERHAQLVAGVAAEMLIGQHEQLLAALPRPRHHRRGVGRRADDAAVLAAEGFDRGRRVDVGDRDDVASAPIDASSRQAISS